MVDTASATTTEVQPPPSGRARHLGRFRVELPNIRDPRLHLMMVIVALQVLGQTVFDFPVSIPQILLPLVTCVAIEGTIVFRRRGVIAWPPSAAQAANGIGLILRVPGTEHGDWWSLKGWWVFVLAGILAMATKYLVKFRGRHVFNPSNIALVLVFVVLGQNVADPQYLWWGPLSVGLVAAVAVILVGSIVITRRVGQGPMSAWFWCVFAVGMALFAASGHGMTAQWSVDPVIGFRYWTILVTSPEILVFTFFMITDPRTTPPGRVGRSIFGAAVGVTACLIIATQSTEFGTKVGLLAALVVLCPCSYLITRLTPARGAPDDSLRAWISGAATGSTRPRRWVWSRSLSALACVSVLALLLVQLSDRSGLVRSDGQFAHLAALRATVPIDDTMVPDVDVDPSLVEASVAMGPAEAAAVARDVVHDLLIEEAAIRSGDPQLAAAAVTGARLEHALDAIEAAPGAGVSTTRYEWEHMKLTLVRLDRGPQAPPDLAVEARGVATTFGRSGEVEGTPSPVELTLVLERTGRTYLVSTTLDAAGRPVRHERAERSDAVPPAVAPNGPSATAVQLAGLSFRDVTEEIGLAQPHSAVTFRDGSSVQTGGAAAGDYDGDGDIDLYVTRIGLPNLLYRNDGGRFTDVGAALGVEGGVDQGSTGALWVDVDADGHLDLLALGFGSTPNRLYRQVDGGFVDATLEWGVPNLPAPNEYATTYSAAASDYDHDGRVDLLIADSEPLRTSTLTNGAKVPGGRPCNDQAIEVIDSQPAAPSRTRLLRNTGTRFEDATATLGLDASMVVSFTPRFVDLDGDSWDDLVIAADYCTSRILLNDKRGGFKDVTRASGAASDENGMGAELIDANGDGRLDLFVTSISYPTGGDDCRIEDVAVGCSGNRLYLSDGDGTFTEATDRYGVRDGYWGWGAAAGDYNLDGRVDLMMTNGYRTVYSDGPDDGSFHDRPLYVRSHDDPDRLWLNVAKGRWPEVSDQVGLTSVGSGKAAIPFDYDGDGRLDLFIADTDGSPRLYRNESANDHHWVTLRLRDPDSANQFAIGATVLVDPGGPMDPVPFRVGADGSFQSGRSTDLHVGLGDVDRVSRIEIAWPDGRTQVLRDVPADRVVTVVPDR